MFRQNTRIPVKLLRDGAKLPQRTGGVDKSCWYDMFSSRIQVGTQVWNLDKKEYEFVPYATTKTTQYSSDTVGKEVIYREGDIIKIDFGFALELPPKKEAIINPRSGTFRKHALVLTNSQGVIDTSYNGDSDEWSSFWYAAKGGIITVGDRVAQFRIQDRQDDNIELVPVTMLGNKNRAGFGSTGR